MSEVEDIINSLIVDVNQWRAFLAMALKANGGTITVKKSETDIEGPFEIVFRRIDEEGTIDSTELEFKLLEGKEEIEKVLGKPSPIVVPR